MSGIVDMALMVVVGHGFLSVVDRVIDHIVSIFPSPTPRHADIFREVVPRCRQPMMTWVPGAQPTRRDQALSGDDAASMRGATRRCLPCMEGPNRVRSSTPSATGHRPPSLVRIDRIRVATEIEEPSLTNHSRSRSQKSVLLAIIGLFALLAAACG